MPTLEINATQPWLITPDGNVAELARLEPEATVHSVTELRTWLAGNG